MRRQLAALLRALAGVLEPAPRSGRLTIGAGWSTGSQRAFYPCDALVWDPSLSWSGSRWTVEESASDEPPVVRTLSSPSGEANKPGNAGKP